MFAVGGTWRHKGRIGLPLENSVRTITRISAKWLKFGVGLWFGTAIRGDIAKPV